MYPSFQHLFHAIPDNLQVKTLQFGCSLVAAPHWQHATARFSSSEESSCAAQGMSVVVSSQQQTRLPAAGRLRHDVQACATGATTPCHGLW
jgi:hypothetical protein